MSASPVEARFDANGEINFKNPEKFQESVWKVCCPNMTNRDSMKTRWVALLDGVNLGGQKSLPMEEVPGVLEASGLEKVEVCGKKASITFSSCLQAQELQDLLCRNLKDNFQLRARLSLMEAARLRDIAEGNPFDVESRTSPENVHVFFLRKRPVQPNFQQIERFKTSDEKWSLTDFAFYLATLGEFKQSKLGVRAGRLLGVTTTRRTWGQVSAILKLLDR